MANAIAYKSKHEPGSPAASSRVVGLPSSLEPLLRPEEVATILGISPRLVYRWASQGVLKTAPLPGRVVRFRPADVQALIDGNSLRDGEPSDGASP